jgi:hypothetical protein
MPPYNGFRLDDHQRLPLALSDTSQENPDHAVAVLQRRAHSATAEDLELIVEGDVLEDQRLPGPKWSSDELWSET